MQPIARRLLPREVWDRPKHGFNVPIDLRLSGSWKSVVEEALDWGERNMELFNYGYLRRLHRMSTSERVIGHELWNPTVLLTWAMQKSPVQMSAA